ncbi:MAG: RDD family protein [Paracoccaceae bacterium]
MTSDAKSRRRARRADAALVIPPEGVPLTLPIAGIGVRLAAQIIDVLITACFVAASLIFLGVTDIVNGTTLVGVGALLFFVIRIPYYVLSELAWNGQTIGKRFMKINVVSHMGGPLTTHALVLRNIMKEAEVFLPGTLILTLASDAGLAGWLSFFWVLMAFAIPLTNPHRMRLGDMLAGTHVIHMPQPILLSDLARNTLKPASGDQTDFSFLSHQLDHYGRFELQTLESYLRAQEIGSDQKQQQKNAETLTAIVDRIRKKIGYADAVPQIDQLAFLRAFYNAQRAHLEQRQLFGDRRGDKHFADGDNVQ